MKIPLKSKALELPRLPIFNLISKEAKLIVMLSIPLSRLLYAVFVVSSENSTVAELATTLQADLSQLQAAASFACRLGWAVKIIDPASILQESSMPGSPKSLLSEEEEGSLASMGSANLSTDGGTTQQGDILWTENYSPAADYSRVAFVVDANITSYLMMGSVSPGLSLFFFSFPFF